jgi:hypothetical protein
MLQQCGQLVLKTIKAIGTFKSFVGAETYENDICALLCKVFIHRPKIERPGLQVYFICTPAHVPDR